LTPRALAAAKAFLGAAADQLALFLRQRREQVQHERVYVAAKLDCEKRYAVGPIPA
jgi:hypothetical protein